LLGGTNQYVGELGSDLFKLPFYGYGGLSFDRYLSPSFDLGVGITYGDMGMWKDTYYNFLTRKFDGNFHLTYKFNNGYILAEDSKFSPYLMLGIGAANYSLGDRESRGFRADKNDLIVPVGLGLKYHINDWFAVGYHFGYNFTNNDDRDVLAENQEGMNDGFFHQSIGVTFSFGKLKDSDGDGVADKFDKCPDTPKGIAVDENGCPHDRDGDGVPDYLDECPDVAGLVALNGCPDRDGDGIPDHLDECPDVAGLAEFNGCPDRDGDGIPDHLDRCPDVPGIPENRGCPEVKEETKKVFEQALTGIQFETGKDVIKRASFPILDKVVKVMEENPEYSLNICGHTDNIGNPDKNMDLSDRRAKSVKQYLIDKGIEEKRMNAEGFGDTKPVEDNKTSQGRAKNRRVEFKVLFE
ncbi:MAG: OmpA family protein, partial [Bacteroidales bacterium]|nr:OmpA family protein [Bacteroidales bacterium]